LILEVDRARWMVRRQRDLIKWGVLVRLAGVFDAGRILQLAYYRPSEFGPIIMDGKEYDVPEEVIAHFRNLRTIGNLGGKVRVTVFDSLFQNRHAHLHAVLALLTAFAQERCIVFLDPDTGLEPRTPTLDHVLGSEVLEIWNAMKKGDVFAFYQHQTNRAGKPWIEPKRDELAVALSVTSAEVKTASGPAIAPDVVFFYTQKA
jgi:hypothetical protein